MKQLSGSSAYCQTSSLNDRRRLRFSEQCPVNEGRLHAARMQPDCRSICPQSGPCLLVQSFICPLPDRLAFLYWKCGFK